MTETNTVYPMDALNRELLSNVHPENWKNPEPRSGYNLVVVGAGTAGLVSAAAAAGLGAKVALIEKGLMGGDCLNVGCVPSKALIRSARARFAVEEASRFGIDSPSVKTSFAAVMERLRRLRAGISHHDSVERFSRLGVDVFLGNGRFIGPRQIEVENKVLSFKKAVIATGGRPADPPIPGLKETGFLTNETVFSLTELPSTLAVIGGGPIGCELAQAFARLGSRVTIIEMSSQFLPREDKDAAEILGDALRKDGIDIHLNTQVTEVVKNTTASVLKLRAGDHVRSLEVERILVGVGRIPNVDGLNLEAAGVEYDTRAGVKTDDRLRTTNRRIYAAGDVASRFQFTHTADAAARVVVQNAFFFGRKKVSGLTIPWCTYTSPEIAHVGMYEHEAENAGIRLSTFRVPFSDVDRAILDGEEQGFLKIHVKQGTDKILGATIVAEHAGEMLSEITLAMTNRIGLGKISSVIHPYPTQAEAIRKAADAYNRTRLTPVVKKLFHKWFEWTA